MSVLAALVLSGAVGFAVAAALLATVAVHGHLTCDWMDGAQKVHDKPVPRVGGIALYAGLWAGAVALPDAGLIRAVLLAALPALVSGLAEDLTGRIRPRLRLGATLGSGLGFVLLTGQVVGATGLPGVDHLLAMPLLAALLTVVAIGGMANAVNLIDGFHGLAAGTVLIGLTGLALAARLAGDAQLFATIVLAAGPVAAFLLLNFPGGRIFLGDGGAYLAGVLLAGFAMALSARNPGVSPLVGLVMLAYPVTETLVSITRRRLAGADACAADGGHLHSLLHARLTRPLAQAAGAPGLANPLTAAVLWPLPILSAGLAVAGVLVPGVLPAGLALIVGLYLGAYLWLLRAEERPAARARQVWAEAPLRDRVRRDPKVRDAA